MREGYLSPPREVDLKPNQLVQLQKLLYELVQSGDYRGRAVRKYLENDLGKKQCIFIAALFFKTFGETLIGVCATYVDDILHFVNKKYCQLLKSTEAKFTCKPREYDKVQFAGVQIERGRWI